MINCKLILTPEAISYAWRQLFRRAGIKAFASKEQNMETLGVAFHYGSLNEKKLASPVIIVTPCSKEAWRTLLTHSEQIVKFMPVNKCIPVGLHFPFEESVPVLFFGVLNTKMAASLSQQG